MDPEDSAYRKKLHSKKNMKVVVAGSVKGKVWWWWCMHGRLAGVFMAAAAVVVVCAKTHCVVGKGDHKAGKMAAAKVPGGNKNACAV